MPLTDLEQLEAELRARRRGRGGLLPGDIPMPPAMSREPVGPPAIDAPPEVYRFDPSILPPTTRMTAPPPMPERPPAGPKGPAGPVTLSGARDLRIGSSTRIPPPPIPDIPQEEEALRKGLTSEVLRSPEGKKVFAPGSEALGIPEAPPVGPPAFEQPATVFNKPPRDFAGERRRLEAMGDIAEGLGNINVITGAQVRAGLVGQPPFHAEGTRRRLARLDQEEADRFTPEELKIIKDQFGLALGPDSRRSTVERLIPQVAALQREKAGARMEMAKAAQAAQKEARLSDAQVKDITSVDKTIAGLKKLREGKGTGEGGEEKINTGPFMEVPFGAVKSAEYFGLNPERAAFRARLSAIGNAYRHEITGAGASAKEIDRIMEALPGLSDDDDTFRAKMDTVIQDMEDYRNQALKNMQAQGKDVTAIRATEPRSRLGPEGKIPVYDPDTGIKLKDVWPDQLSAARERGAVTAEELAR